MRRLLAAGTLALLLTSCSNHHLVPPDGTVTDREHSESWVQLISCGKGCISSIYWPEAWHLEITATHNPGWKGEVEVHQDVFDRCKRGALWPQCSCVPKEDD